MQINILGPLEVFRNGVVITPSAPKLRTVLSLLAVQSNSVVRTDQIIEELWQDSPPNSVTTTLQTYIYQLRKLLQLAAGPGHHSGRVPPAVALRTSPYGYVLSLPPDQLDFMRFERLAPRGRAELEAGDVTAAAEALSAALRLWRGPALVDVSTGPALQAEILRLEEMHKNALEWRIETDLELGRHHELLGELTRLVAQQPTHEGFQAKLMLALHRAGRRSEALDVYQRMRTALANELGLDPSSDLQRLHRAVLAADRSLDPPTLKASVHVSPRSDLLRQLPPEGPTLVGRQAEVTATLAALSSGPRHAPKVVVIVGPPGCGKSALCTRAAHESSGGYPDGQLHAILLDSCNNPVDPGHVLGEFLRSVGVPDQRIPASTAERSRMFWSWTADRRVLVTLDDVVSVDQLLPLVPSGVDCAVLAASRRTLSAPTVTATVELSPLTVEQGIELLTNVLGEHRVAEDDEAWRGLVRLCDGLPAALHAAAIRLRVRPHWQLVKLARWISNGVARPTTLTHDAHNLYTCVVRTYQLMPFPVRTAFRLLTALDAPSVSLAQAAGILHLTEPHAESLLDELLDLRLIEVTMDESVGLRYRFLPSLRAVGRQLPADTDMGEHVTIPIPPQHVGPDTCDKAWSDLRVGHEPVWR